MPATPWPKLRNKTFDFLATKTPGKRMELLELFLQFWFGPHRPEYGVPEEELAPLNLPKPLYRFHHFAGRWPKREARYDNDVIYEHGGYHHLLPVDRIKPSGDGKIEFVMEYQGDWKMVTEQGKVNPPIWIQGFWDGCPEEIQEQDHLTKVSMSLTDYLISHALLIATLQTPMDHHFEEVSEAYYKKHADEFIKIWEIPDFDLPLASGTFYQLGEMIALHQHGKTKLHATSLFGVYQFIHAIQDYYRGEEL